MFPLRTPEGRHFPMWDDVRIVPGAFQFAGAADPLVRSWQPGGAGATFKVYGFDNGDEAFFTLQMPHSYMLGTDLYVHVHWTPADRGVAESGKTVAWKLDYSIADLNEVFPASATLDLTDTCDGVNHKQQMTPQVVISPTGITKLSAMFVCRIYRDAGDTWAGGPAAGELPVLLEVDIHFQIDSPGSRWRDTK